MKVFVPHPGRVGVGFIIMCLLLTGIIFSGFAQKTGEIVGQVYDANSEENVVGRSGLGNESK